MYYKFITFQFLEVMNAVQNNLISLTYTHKHADLKFRTHHVIVLPCAKLHLKSYAN